MYLQSHQESKHGDIIFYCDTCEFKAERQIICNNIQDTYDGVGHSSESVGTWQGDTKVLNDVFPNVTQDKKSKIYIGI